MKDNIPAFPSSVAISPTGDVYQGQYEGMTLLDYFAGQALMGYRSAYHQWCQRVGHDKMAEPENMAQWAYADANAMLQERAKYE